MVVLRLAMPAFSVTVPRTAAPFLNVTVPVGVPDEDETVALKATAWPYVEGFGEEISATALAAGFTTWLRIEEALPAKLAFPLYTAVMAFVPGVSVVVVILAEPPVRVTVPSAAVPFLNVTVPAGVPEEEETVAVKVTACPYVEGFGEDISATALAAWFTTWLSTAEVLPDRVALPLYTAVMDLDPGVRVVVVILAVPPASFTAPSDAAPFLKVTVPVGVPAFEVTMAVNTTAWP